MSAVRAGTWLGDVAEVIDALGLTSPRDTQRIAAMLGLELAEPEAAPSPLPRAVEPTPDEPTGPASATATGPRATRLRNLAPLALPPLEPDSTQPLPEPGPESGAPALPEENDDEPPPALPFRPLLPPRTAASVVAAAVRTWGPGSRIDERRTVDKLARGHPIREFPRRPRLSLNRGVQVLVDLGDALDPYGRDQQYVVDLVQRTVGPEATTVGSFENCPSRGVWMLPRPATLRGRPVLVLTDLGLGGPLVQPARASVAEWCRYARARARAGSPVIALVPYPLDRAYRAASRRVAVVPWDRASISAVQNARRRAS